MTADSTTLQAESMQLSAAERELYRRPNRGRLIIDLCLPWVQAILGAAIFIANPGVIAWLVAVVLIAGAQHGLSLISHEAVHRLLWPESKRINDFVATYFFAAPAVLPFNVYRQRHLIHHRLVSKEGDTKNYYLRDLSGMGLFKEILRSVSGIDYFLQAFSALDAGKGEEYEDFEENLSRDKRSLVIVHLVLFGVFTAFDPLYYYIPTYYVLLWLGPMLTVSLLFGKLRSIVEHQPPRSGYDSSSETEYFKNTPGPMLRSVRATWLERLFLSKINFHFHGEHHLWPWISYQHLPTVNAKLWQGRELGELREINGYVVVCDKSYGAVICRLMLGR
jgi:fatty acid desaturase